MKELPKDAIVLEIGGGVHQRRSGNINKKFEHYIPVDISYSSIKKYVEKYQRPGVVADAKRLPFKDKSVDAVFTHTFLEHPLEPEKVLKEIVRIIKPGGIIIHNDAWFCRWWNRYGVVGLKQFREMDLKEKFISAAARITGFPLLRFSPIILKRFAHELFVTTDKPIKLRYGKLNPNYELYLACDEDAANSIDPVDLICYYESRGFESWYKLSFKERVFSEGRLLQCEKVRANSNEK